MPTYETTPHFTTDLSRLSPAQRRAFNHVVTRAFVPDLRAGHFRTGLRVKRVQRTPGIYELTWSMGTGPAGRATFAYGGEVHAGTPHVIWRRIGTHGILAHP
ncbi:hypothetical protein EAO73_35130 [Streptomyces sp. col6]|uniref:hypothetical protein n=1 Tax=Streptomyces sp. col6 TaxID=2478958 RepID=UPI0011CE915A|nr:hypothetical protein [Streptomyces sp. col6]TXR94516.1 hypothetical protein EAO73_35130 [Streptomyces sp. col6]